MAPDDPMSRPRTRAVKRRQQRGRSALPASTYRVRVDLENARPPIWRRLELASDLRLDELHEVLQVAFGWGGDHLHQFSDLTRRWEPGPADSFFDNPFRDASPAEDEKHARLGEVLHEPGDRLDYWYDFGDDWNHVISLEEVTERADGAPRARVVAGRRAAPPDDCGGIYGYEELLDALQSPRDPEDAELVEWAAEMGLGPDFDPSYVDLEALDHAVQHILG